LFQYRIISFAIANSVSLDIFFLISGFVISYSVMREYQRNGGVRWSSFLVKRFARLYPCYLIVLLACLPVWWPNAHNVWANLLQVNNFVPEDKQYLIWTWSLAAEFQFYLIFALILMLVKDWSSKRWLFNVCIFLMFVPVIVSFAVCYHANYFYLDHSFFLLGHPNHLWVINHIFDKLPTRMAPILFVRRPNGIVCNH